MRSGNLNEHGQPFSKKQRKASRHMMAMRRGGGFNRAPSQQIDPRIMDKGFMAGLLGLLLGSKGFRRNKV